MYLAHNEAKSVVAERFIRTFKNNCDGFVLEIHLEHNFQRLQEGSNRKSFAYEVVT